MFKVDKSSNRQSNIELLRILAILMIIMHHMSLHTQWSDAVSASVNPEYLWIRFIMMGGKLGVNVFVLISGYFLSMKKEGFAKRAFELWRMMFFYSVSCYIVGVMVGNVEFSYFQLIKYFFPVTTVPWWYATTYFVLFLLAPYINRLVDYLEKKDYRTMLVIMFVIWSFIPTATNYIWEGNNITWFIFLYLLGAYIRKYNFLHDCSRKKTGVLALFAIMVAYVLATLNDLYDISEKIYGVSNNKYFYEMNHVTTLVSSVLIFLFFLKTEMGTKKLVNNFASMTFAVYMIHDSQCIQGFLWNKIVRAMKYGNSLILIPYTIFATLAVFMVCSLIEIVRKNTVESLIKRIIQRWGKDYTL